MKETWEHMIQKPVVLQKHLEAGQIIQGVRNGLRSEIKELSLPLSSSAMDGFTVRNNRKKEKANRVHKSQH